MQIDVEHVARLARLGLSQEEKKLFGEQLGKILDHAETLKKLDTDKVEPLTHALPLKNVMREDKVVPCADTEAILNNAPDCGERMFKVPRILE